MATEEQPPTSDTFAGSLWKRPAPEGEARDSALDKLEVAREELVEVAKTIALNLAREDGTVTSPRVLAQMRSDGYAEDLERYDRRWMGAVFRNGKLWERVGWSSSAGSSHRRPVAVWKLREG